MIDTVNSSELRRWAAQCKAQADDPRRSGDERDRLLKMREVILTVAKTADWLASPIQESGSMDLPPAASKVASKLAEKWLTRSNDITGIVIIDSAGDVVCELP